MTKKEILESKETDKLAAQFMHHYLHFQSNVAFYETSKEKRHYALAGTHAIAATSLLGGYGLGLRALGVEADVIGPDDFLGVLGIKEDDLEEILNYDPFK